MTLRSELFSEQTRNWAAYGSRHPALPHSAAELKSSLSAEIWDMCGSASTIFEDPMSNSYRLFRLCWK
jgi:hypothetical protein